MPKRKIVTIFHRNGAVTVTSGYMVDIKGITVSIWTARTGRDWNFAAVEHFSNVDHVNISTT